MQESVGSRFFDFWRFWFFLTLFLKKCTFFREKGQKNQKLLLTKIKRLLTFGVKNFWIFFLLLGIPPKWEKVKKIIYFERELANAHFKTIQGSFECKIEVWQHLEVRNAKKWNSLGPPLSVCSAHEHLEIWKSKISLYFSGRWHFWTEFSFLQMLSGINIFVTKLLLKMRQLAAKMWYFEPKMRKLLFKMRQLETKMWYFQSQMRNFYRKWVKMRNF